MEYFLYVLVEAQRLIKELDKLNYTIPLTQELINQCRKDKHDMATQLAVARQDMSRGANSYLNKGIEMSRK